MRTHQTIRRLRENAGMSQGELAIQLQLLGMNVSQPWVSGMELGKIRLTPEMLPYIAMVLNVTPNDLVGWDEFVRQHRS
ncbi:helix-turn-helix domain-containing protein [Symbiobacterium terraclitae]|uniref:helix-turn-helix domain-containing protein n=1 Tax=Symbiobacterium terraclitae TaxID=557451 RepID=UPI0035B55257